MENKSRIYRLLGLCAFVVALGLITSHADAGERKPSREDLANLSDVKQNQECLVEARPAYTTVTTAFANKTKIEGDAKQLIRDYNRFLDCKTWNEAEIAELAKNDWNVDWETMTLVDMQKSNGNPPPSVPAVKKEPTHAAAPKTVASTPAAPPGLDLDKLAIAVAKHETAYCTSPGSPTANARNNCWGIMHWPNGKRTLRTFKTTDEGKEAFKRLWARSYKRFPDLALATTYSGNDKAATWLANVTRFYNEL